MEEMGEAAGAAATDAYTTAIEGGADPAEAATQAIEAAGAVMTDMGAPADMVDTMASAATEGFQEAADAGMNPQECFDAAGDSVETAFGGDPAGPPPEGDMGPPPEGDMGPPPEGDMGPPPEGAQGRPPEVGKPVPPPE